MALDREFVLAIIVFSSIVAAMGVGVIIGVWASNYTHELEKCQTDLKESVALHARCDERKIHFEDLNQLHNSSIESINAAVKVWKAKANNVNSIIDGLTSKMEANNAAMKNSVSELQQQITTVMREYISKLLQKLVNPIKDMNSVSSKQLDKLMSDIEVLTTNISKRFNSVLDQQQKSRTALKDLSLEQQKHLKSHIDEMTSQSVRAYDKIKHFNLVQSDELKITLAGLVKSTEEGRVSILEVLEDPDIKQRSEVQGKDRTYRPDYPMLTLIILNIFLMLYYVKKTEINRNPAARHQHVS